MARQAVWRPLPVNSTARTKEPRVVRMTVTATPVAETINAPGVLSKARSSPASFAPR